MAFAHHLWTRIEAVHAVGYFDHHTREAATQAGLPGFWQGYFALRAAPLGAVSAAAAEAIFAGFAPDMVREVLPKAWATASPEQLLDLRAHSAARTILEAYPAAAEVAQAVNRTLEAATLRAAASGRPLFAANRDLPLPTDPVQRLWQLCTTLREHRGDGHVAVLTAAGVDGLSAHLMRHAGVAATEGGEPQPGSGVTPERLRSTRGWTESDWNQALSRLHGAGLVDAYERLTPAGRAVRDEIEDRTDHLADQPYAALGDAERAGLIEALHPLAVALATSVITYPNPMALPSPGE